MPDTITIDVPAGFDHHAAIYEKARPIGPIEPKYTMILPADAGRRFDNVRFNRDGNHCASSTLQPMIMIGDGLMRDGLDWQVLISRAQGWRFPLDKLLVNRPLRVACQLWKPNGRFATGHDAINIVGIQVLGDLTKCDLLDAHVDEVRGWFA